MASELIVKVSSGPVVQGEYKDIKVGFLKYRRVHRL